MYGLQRCASRGRGHDGGEVSVRLRFPVNLIAHKNTDRSRAPRETRCHPLRMRAHPLLLRSQARAHLRRYCARTSKKSGKKCEWGLSRSCKTVFFRTAPADPRRARTAVPVASRHTPHRNTDTFPRSHPHASTGPSSRSSRHRPAFHTTLTFYIHHTHPRMNHRDTANQACAQARR